MRNLFLILCLLVAVQVSCAQTYHPADSVVVIRMMDDMLALKNKDIKKQDSLLQAAINLSQKIKRNDYLVRFYHLWSALRLQQNEYKEATRLCRKAIDAGRKASLENTISFRDATTHLAMCYSYMNKKDSTLRWVEYGKNLSRLAKDKFNYSILLTLEAINRTGDLTDKQVEILYDSAVTTATYTDNPHDDMMAGFNKAYFLKINAKQDWVRSIETLTALQKLIDHPALSVNKGKPYHRVAFWFRSAKVSVYAELSSLYFQLSDLGNACYYQEEIVKEYRRIGNYTYLPYLWSDLAMYETFRENAEKVKQIYDSCRLLIRQHFKKEDIPIPSFYYAGGWLAEQKKAMKKPFLCIRKHRPQQSRYFMWQVLHCSGRMQRLAGMQKLIHCASSSMIK